MLYTIQMIEACAQSPFPIPASNLRPLRQIFQKNVFLRNEPKPSAPGPGGTYNRPMVRPERRRDVLTGGSPVRVSAGAPGSRFPSGGEIRPYEAECQKPLKERGANQRAATRSERNSLV